MGFLIVTAVFPPEPVVSAQLSFDLASAAADKTQTNVLSPKPTRPFGFKFDKTHEKLKFNHFITDSYTCPQSSLFGRLRETYSFGKHTYKYIEANHVEIDLIYSNTWPLMAQFYTVKAAKKFGIPVVIHVQDIYPESLSNKLPIGKVLLNAILMPFDKFIFRHANKVIAISLKMKDYLIKTRGIAADKIFVIENWQNEEKFNLPVSPLQKNEPFTFMYLGNIGPVAGCELLIDAFIHANLTNCRLVIAGSGSVKDELEKKCKDVTNVNIQFWEVPNGETQKVQALANVMLLPMKQGAASSSVPSKLSAYMFSKKPIIACVDDNSDTASAIRAGNCGWVIPSEDIEQLAAQMREITTMPESNLTIKGNNGYNYAIDHYSKANNLKKMLEIIGI